MASTENMEYQKVINYLIDLMREGKLIIGSKIPSERDLAEQIGIGRNSTREALSILRGMGLIESKHGSGNYISGNCGASIKSIVSAMLALGSISKKDIVEFRRTISNTICQMILEKGFDAEERKELSSIVQQMQKAQMEEFIQLDRRFHAKLIGASKNSLFITIMEPIGEIYLDLVPEVVEHSFASERDEMVDIHSSLFRALDQGDVIECQKQMSRHFDFVSKNVI